MTTTQKPSQSKTSRTPLNPGDRVSMRVGGSDYYGEVVEDDGGQHIKIEVDGLGIFDLFHGMISLENG